MEQALTLAPARTALGVSGFLALGAAGGPAPIEPLVAALAAMACPTATLVVAHQWLRLAAPPEEIARAPVEAFDRAGLLAFAFVPVVLFFGAASDSGFLIWRLACLAVFATAALAGFLDLLAVEKRHAAPGGGILRAPRVPGPMPPRRSVATGRLSARCSSPVPVGGPARSSRRWRATSRHPRQSRRSRRWASRSGWGSEEFASNVSHEFRTPLTTLRGTVEVLADDVAMPVDQRARFHDNARTDLDRLSAMVDGLLALARVEEGGERSPVDVDALVADVVARFEGVTLSGRAGSIPGDVSQLDLAVTNVLQNAMEHGVAPVTVHLSPEGIEVRDAGRISDANLPRVFDRFFTAGRERRGTGLGLAIVRAICVAHGGDATVESGPTGTVVRLRWGQNGF